LGVSEALLNREFANFQGLKNETEAKGKTMGMQDNPLVGDYTKGISKNTVAYFEGLERRARREKAPLSSIAFDLGNPLFGIIKAPLDPLKMLARPVDKSPEPVVQVVESNQPIVTSGTKKRWEKVALGDLRAALGFPAKQHRDTKKQKKVTK
jgi:hypothetical protein